MKSLRCVGYNDQTSFVKLRSVSSRTRTSGGGLSSACKLSSVASIRGCQILVAIIAVTSREVSGVGAELLLDTGPLVALLDAAERRHGDCVEVLSGWDGRLVTTEPVVTEAAYLLGSAGVDGSLALRFCLQGGAVVQPWTDERASRAVDLMRKYHDVPMDYADASLVALAEELGTPQVFTLDLRGFRAYRWKSRRSFQIFPSA
ncbi:MAG TPA: PIN domain-containing protein [Polyangiaceae bacterium]